MQNLYRTSLEVRLHTIDETSLQSESQRQTYFTVSQILSAPANASATASNPEWDEIYKAESLIALLFNGAQLRQEIVARLQDLAKEDRAEADTLGRDYEALSKRFSKAANREQDDVVLRGLLLRIMEAIHWSAKKKYLARPIRKEATNRILCGLLLSFVLLIAPYIYVQFDYNGPTLNKWWSLFALWTVLTSGLLGAFFSRLITLQRQWANLTLDDVFLHREWPYTLLRAGVGVCGALIAYFFLRSGLAAGAIFPVFEEIRIEIVDINGALLVPMSYVMPSKSLALLTFWCFLAGFSEALVPNILGGAERQFTSAASQWQPTRS
jgi:hypothetical protein